jgi:hypothetical protein
MPKITYESGGKSALNTEEGNKEITAVVDESFHSAVMKAATTAANVSALIEKLQPLFPDHNVAAEYERCLKYRKGRGLAPGGGKKFAEWMLRAEKPLKGQSGAETSESRTKWISELVGRTAIQRQSALPEMERRSRMGTKRILGHSKEAQRP